MKKLIILGCLALTSMAFANSSVLKIEDSLSAQALVLNVRGDFVKFRELITFDKNILGACFQIGKSAEKLSFVKVSGGFSNSGSLELQLNRITEILNQEFVNGLCSSSSTQVEPNRVSERYGTIIQDLDSLNFY